MNRLEERYRRVLRFLPVAYRHKWEEDMVATFLLTAQPKDPEEAEFAADYGSPSWSEVASVLALAVRLRLGGVGAPARYLVWGDAVRRVALMGLLLHAVTALVGLAARLWSPALIDGRVLFWLLWVAAYVSLVVGRWRTARWLAVLAQASALVFLGLDVAAGEGTHLLSRIAELLVDLLLVAALAAFHRQAVPVKPRPWLLALPAGFVLMALTQLVTQLSQNRALLDWSSLICVAVVFAAIAHLVMSRGRTASWSSALALLAFVALGLRVVTLLDYLQFAARGADLTALVTIGVVEAVAVLAVASVLTVVAKREMRRLSGPTADLRL